MKACSRCGARSRAAATSSCTRAGWLEGGLRCSYEKIILDIDLLQMVAEFLTPLDLSDDALGVDAIRESARAAISSARQHTQARYKTAFYCADPLRLAQLRDLGRGRLADRDRAGQPGLEGAPRGLRGALHGPGDPRGARRLRRQAQAPKAARRRIFDRLARALMAERSHEASSTSTASDAPAAGLGSYAQADRSSTGATPDRCSSAGRSRVTVRRATCRRTSRLRRGWPGRIHRATCVPPT